MPEGDIKKADDMRALHRDIIDKYNETKQDVKTIKENHLAHIEEDLKFLRDAVVKITTHLGIK